MKRVNNFNEFYFFKLLENKNETLPLYFSNRFKSILVSMNNEISIKLLSIERSRHDDLKSLRTYIDIDEQSDDKISFIMVNKIREVLPDVNKDDIDFYSPYYLEHDKIEKLFKARQRSTIKINRFVNEVFNNEYESKKLTEQEKEHNRKYGIRSKPQILEEFLDKYKSFRKTPEFRLVKGDDIIKYYDSDNYFNNDLGTLGDSCMKYKECLNYIKFYTKNDDKVSLLILMDRENKGKIIGRALVWYLDEPENRIFMDRIYTNFKFDEENFKKYASDNGWLYKYRQNNDQNEYIVDTKTDTKQKMSLYIYDFENHDRYPYMDTIKFYNKWEKILTNISTMGYYELESTSGSITNSRFIYSEREIRDTYAQDILSNFKYFCQNEFIDDVWKFIDSDEMLDDLREKEIDYFMDNFNEIPNSKIIEFIIEKKDLIKSIDYIDDINDLDFYQIHNLVQRFDLKDDIIDWYVDNKYNFHNVYIYLVQKYGENSVKNLDDNIYDIIDDYIDKTEMANNMAEYADLNILRRRYI